MNITSPIIHIGGTSGEALTKETEDAVDALRKALRALEAMTVHGRDYPNGNYVAARHEHGCRLEQIHDVIKGLEARWSDIVDQMDVIHACRQPTGT